MKIGSIIKKQRQARDLTQEQLAEYLNVSVSAVSQWESGKNVPDISTILSFTSLILSSASVILLLVPSRVFLTSVIALFIIIDSFLFLLGPC